MIPQTIDVMIPQPMQKSSILPLPAEVIAQIKSSTAIVSLAEVVLELLKNALDAQATRIDATIDFARGACTVEDDGLGIPPLEFREDGGLGKLYCTSKHEPHQAPLLGRHGMFLASLAAVSLLSITSRHHQHRSHNSVTFHHAKTVERQLPAPPHHDVSGKQGTRVTVRNLFGNLPVRVKQRLKVVEHKAENDRLWDLVKTSVVGLLLSWGGSVSLKARDVNNRLVFAFNVSDSRQAVRSRPTETHKSSSTHIASLLSILTQANYISIDERSSWVPVSASTSALSIKGAIALHPAPSRSVQFISLGVHPLAPETKHNELYDEVNRLFRLSTFGAVEDDADANHVDRTRRLSDKRYKAEGHTNRSLKARKGVDRYPMFHLRIFLHMDHSQGLSEDRLMDGRTNLQAVVGVLGAMVTQWLSIYHFRPIGAPQKRERFGTSSVTHIGSSEYSSNPTSAKVDATHTATSKMFKPDTAGVPARKHKRTGTIEVKRSSEGLRHRAFAEWSRIKSGKAEFFTDSLTLSKFDEVRSFPMTTSVDHVNCNTDTVPCQLRPITSTERSMQMLPQGIMSVQASEEDASGEELEPVATDHYTHDDTILWTDPFTNRTHILNARTGCVVPPARLPFRNVSSSEMPLVPHARPETSLRLQPKTAAIGTTPWLDNVFKTWDNPVFNTSEQRIKKVTLQEHGLDQGMRQHAQQQCHHIYKDSADAALPVNGSTRLSKESLLGAEVVAQVDKKFILVKLKSYCDTNPPQEVPKNLLVLIDQHAADERIQVETLFQKLCTPATTSCSGYRSKLGHNVQVASVVLDKPIQFTISQLEQRHFITYAARFAFWGILFDTSESTTLAEKLSSLPEKRLLSVTALPPSVSERCKADVALLISFLRSTIWKYASDPHLPSHAQFTPDETSTNWVRRLASCPEGLVDMINSRACRSAIMFNDELDLDTCKTLVQRLAICKFPFICAHGRPSLVPLVNIARDNDSSRKDLDVFASNGSFVEKWKQWVR